jgi:hypothetical protein
MACAAGLCCPDRATCARAFGEGWSCSDGELAFSLLSLLEHPGGHLKFDVARLLRTISGHGGLDAQSFKQVALIMLEISEMRFPKFGVFEVKPPTTNGLPTSVLI